MLELPPVNNRLQSSQCCFKINLFQNVLQLNELFRSLPFFIQNTVLLIQLKKFNDFSCRRNSQSPQDQHEIRPCPYHWAPSGLRTVFSAPQGHAASSTNSSNSPRAGLHFSHSFWKPPERSVMGFACHQTDVASWGHCLGLTKVYLTGHHPQKTLAESWATHSMTYKRFHFSSKQGGKFGNGK